MGDRSRFVGVSEQTAKGLFVASIVAEGRTLKLGGWLREIDAAIAFDRAVLWFGRERELNFPSESKALGPCSPEDLRRAALTQRKRARGSASEYRGVTRKKAVWQVVVKVNGVRESAAGFETEEEAARAYDRLLLGLGGDRAKLNFPDERIEPTTGMELRAQLHARQKSKRTSLFRGVSAGPHSRWHAEIHAEGRRHRAGEWTDETTAAEAYDRAVLFFGVDPARRNFPARALSPASPTDLRAESRAQTKAARTSQYHGVTWVAADASGAGAWRAEIVRDGVHHVIGRFDDELEAAVAFDRVARASFSAPPTLNFPTEPTKSTSLEDMRLELRAKYKQTTTSRYNGVSWAEHVAAWLAGIEVNGVYHFLGYHDDEALAARAYDRKRRELRGEGPYNFPD